MRRLSVQLALAMLGTMVLTLLVIAGTQRWAELRRFYQLPEEVRDRLPHPRPLLPDGISALFAPTSPRGPSPIRPEPGGHGAPLEGEDLDDGGYSEQLASSYRTFNRFQNEALLLGVGLAAAMSLALALWLSRLVARPIERVSQATSRLASGDLSARVPQPPRGSVTNLETARLTESFNQMAQALEGYERERKAMIADIAHELRTPLTALTLRLQALKDGLVPLEAAEVASLNRSAALLSRLVEDLRVLSLADAGRLTLRRRVVDLTELAADVFEDFRPRFDDLEIEGVLELPAGEVLASIDPDRMTQVLGNLLDNALRVTPAGGAVTMTLTSGGDHARLGVRDTGPGLSDEAAAKAFDRYFQDKDVDYGSSVAGASGLGLAIVRTLVELHGGSVRATNVLEPSGAEFEVLLPIAPVT